jgi:hypothetical protein
MKLASFEKRWAHVAFGVIFPGDEKTGLAGMGTYEETSAFVEEVCVRVPFQSALGLRIAIWIATFAPLFVIARFALLASLSTEDRERVITRLVASESYVLRSLVLILKTIGAMYYGAKSSVRVRMGLAPAADESGKRLSQPLVPLRLKRPAAA